MSWWLCRQRSRMFMIALIILAGGCAAENRSASPADEDEISAFRDLDGHEVPEEQLDPDASVQPEDIVAMAAPADSEPDAVPLPRAPSEMAPSSHERPDVSLPERTVRVRHEDLVGVRRGYSVERVYFATNRSQPAAGSGDATPDSWFGSERADLVYGSCEVSIPYRRQRGSLPEPSVLRLEFRQDPSRHVVLMQLELLPQSDFHQQLQRDVAASREPHLLLFIHGYTTSFRDAARRTAQLAYDMNYPGPSMFFSWPAGGPEEGLNRWNYLTDLRRADESREDLIAVLESVAATAGVRQIHLVVHSMGNHVLTEALQTMADRNSTAFTGDSLISSVAMAAPDVNAQEFVDRTASRITRFAKRFTVYASRHDKALMFSQKVNGWNPLGLISTATARVSSLPSFELVDASAVSDAWFSSGHVYYGDMPEVIADLRCVFTGLPLARRGLLQEPPLLRMVRHSR